MYKTREDVEAMIEIIEITKEMMRNFCFWVLDSLSTPTPGVVHTEPGDDNARIDQSRVSVHLF